jgi:MFS family permease
MTFGAIKSRRLSDRLFTPRFFVMCGYTFTVFLSAFQLFPTAPFHIIALGGSTFASGLFLGLLTYASAFSAPLTGSLVDRVGAQRVLMIASAAITAFSIAYAIMPDYRIVLAVVVVHGMFWSGLLTGSGAYLTGILPAGRRAEGFAYWGLASVAAIAVAPTIGFWVFRFGWPALCIEAASLNVLMAIIAWRLPPERHAEPRAAATGSRRLVEWRILILSFTLFLYSFGYGGVTSFTALYADANGVTPKGIYLTALALVILVTRPLSGRLGDRFGYRHVLLPSLILIAGGLFCLVGGGTRPWLLSSALLFGAGFGTAYPVFVGYVLEHVRPERRGAAFGSILACFDTGIGTGSTSLGWIIGRYGFATAFGAAAALATLALPYFLAADWLIDRRASAGDRSAPVAPPTDPV